MLSSMKHTQIILTFTQFVGQINCPKFNTDSNILPLPNYNIDTHNLPDTHTGTSIPDPLGGCEMVPIMEMEDTVFSNKITNKHIPLTVWMGSERGAL